MLNHELYDQQSIIYYACSKCLNTEEYEILEIIKESLDAGVQPDLTSNGYSTPLIHIVSNLTTADYFYDDFGTDGEDVLKVALINLLIDYGADINALGHYKGSITSLFKEIHKREGMHPIVFNDLDREEKSLSLSRQNAINLKGVVNLTEVNIGNKQKLAHAGNEVEQLI